MSPWDRKFRSFYRKTPSRGNPGGHTLESGHVRSTHSGSNPPGQPGGYHPPCRGCAEPGGCGRLRRYPAHTGAHEPSRPIQTAGQLSRAQFRSKNRPGFAGTAERPHRCTGQRCGHSRPLRPGGRPGSGGH